VSSVVILIDNWIFTKYFPLMLKYQAQNINYLNSHNENYKGHLGKSNSYGYY